MEVEPKNTEETLFCGNRKENVSDNEFDRVISRLEGIKSELGRIGELELNPFVVFKHMFPLESSRTNSNNK